MDYDDIVACESIAGTVNALEQHAKDYRQAYDEASMLMENVFEKLARNEVSFKSMSDEIFKLSKSMAEYEAFKNSQSTI